MGMRCSISEVTKHEFEQVKAHPDLDLSPSSLNVRHAIDKDWEAIHELLRDKGAPWNLAMTGDWRHPALNVTFEEFLDPGADAYFAFVSVGLVQRVAAVFGALPETDMDRWYEEKGLKDRGELRALAEIYRLAAERGAALCILIS